MSLGSPCWQLVVPGEQAATLGALREAVASAMGVAPEKQHLAYVDNHYKICNLLAGDHSAHLLHLGLSGGEKLLLEEARELSTQAGSTTRDAGKEADEDAATGAPHVMTYHLEKQVRAGRWTDVGVDWSEFRASKLFFICVDTRPCIELFVCLGEGYCGARFPIALR